LKQEYKSEIRKWLETHPLKDDQELDVYGVPDFLFDLTDNDDRLKLLNRQIKSLPLQQQKLLLYLARDIEPRLIIESMEYASPELFWLDKALLIKIVDSSARKNDVLLVFAANEFLLNEIHEVADSMEQEVAKTKKRKLQILTLIAVPIVLLFVGLFVLPEMNKPNPVALFEQFKSAYQPPWTSIDTTSFAGGNYYEAFMLLKEDHFTESARLFEETVVADAAFRTGSRWFLALINLQKGDLRSCRDQLRAIKSEDPAFYRSIAKGLDTRL